MLDAYIDKKDKHTCISCHMPQIMGSKTTLSNSKTHAFHGIAGIHQQTESLGQYIDFEIEKNLHGFNVKIINQANHALFGEAYREGILEVTILRAGKTLRLKPYIFTRIFAKDGKECMPFEATEVLKDTLIYAKKTINYDVKVQTGDKITLSLGIKLISDKAAKKLNLQDDKDLTKIKLLKVESFKF
jgi:formate-dependent nitrite reductase cytochrome c552 subunit